MGILCALHTYCRQLNQHPYFHLSDTRGGLDITYDVWRELFFKKHAWKQSGAESSSDCLPQLSQFILAARRG
ncbi:transposase [Salmonella enterica]|nr:transposase [Salmonella enterica]EJB8929575.1 transposase [Salmonella enterica]EJC0360836.1 transposase [Salmonella enterica]EJK5691978.1 transposase [Salmonella enterica]